MHLSRWIVVRRAVLPVVALIVAMTRAPAAARTAAPGPQSSVPDIGAYPPMANDAAPGASASATATATAIGRGVNFGNMFEAPTEGAWGLTVTDDFIDKATAAGFRSVRLPVRWSNHAGAQAPFTIDAAFMARVESVVDKLLAKGRRRRPQHAPLPAARRRSARHRRVGRQPARWSTCAS